MPSDTISQIGSKPSFDAIVIGGGLTGLCTSYSLERSGVEALLLESASRFGGQIRSYRSGDFIYESGPNTGVISTPEVVELFNDLGDEDLLQIANAQAKRRLIYKRGAFHPLPSGLKSAISTSLFSVADKLRILGEPWRKRGEDPNESIGSLVRRRLGSSYLHYAVDPFVGGIYAGDPSRLVTRHALPKLYALEYNHGSFIRGAIALSKIKKTPRQLLATREVFSVRGGLERLVEALYSRLCPDRALHSAQITALVRREDGLWQVTYEHNGATREAIAPYVLTTIGTNELISLLPDAPKDALSAIRAMRYAPVVQVSVGYKSTNLPHFNAFGGLVPSCEDSQVLGILNPSASFSGRAPEGGLMLSVFLGGMRDPGLINLGDTEIEQIVLDRLHRMLGLAVNPDLLHISRHPRAIPQYEASTDARLEAIKRLEELYPGLFIGGNMLAGIGMSDRIAQGRALAMRVLEGQKG